MIGQKWEQAQGTIVGAQPDTSRRSGARYGPPQSAAYDLDVQMPDGSHTRAQVASGHHRGLQPGQIVRLEVNAKTGEIRLPAHANQLIIGFDMSASGVQDNSAASGGLRGASGLGATLRAGGAAGLDLTQFFGDSFGDSFASGTEISYVGGPEAFELVRTMMSGDPAARAAAREQFRQLAINKTTGQGQVPNQGQAPSQSQGQHHSPSDRLTRLQEMVHRGQISQDEFDAKRQQILDEL